MICTCFQVWLRFMYKTESFIKIINSNQNQRMRQYVLKLSKRYTNGPQYFDLYYYIPGGAGLGSRWLPIKVFGFLKSWQSGKIITCVFEIHCQVQRVESSVAIATEEIIASNIHKEMRPYIDHQTSNIYIDGFYTEMHVTLDVSSILTTFNFDKPLYNL